MPPIQQVRKVFAHGIVYVSCAAAVAVTFHLVGEREGWVAVMDGQAFAFAMGSIIWTLSIIVGMSVIYAVDSMVRKWQDGSQQRE